MFTHGDLIPRAFFKGVSIEDTDTWIEQQLEESLREGAVRWKAFEDRTGLEKKEKEVKKCVDEIPEIGESWDDYTGGVVESIERLNVGSGICEECELKIKGVVKAWKKLCLTCFKKRIGPSVWDAHVTEHRQIKAAKLQTAEALPVKVDGSIEWQGDVAEIRGLPPHVSPLLLPPATKIHDVEETFGYGFCLECTTGDDCFFKNLPKYCERHARTYPTRSPDFKKRYPDLSTCLILEAKESHRTSRRHRPSSRQVDLDFSGYESGPG